MTLSMETTGSEFRAFQKFELCMFGSICPLLVQPVLLMIVVKNCSVSTICERGRQVEEGGGKFVLNLIVLGKEEKNLWTRNVF